MHRTFTFAGAFLLAATVPVFSQQQKSSFWDTPKQEPAKATAPAAKPAPPAANSAKSTSAKATEVAAPEKPKSFWETPRETTSWTGWSGSGTPPKSEPAPAKSGGDAKSAESAAAPAKAAGLRPANDVVAAVARTSRAEAPVAAARAPVDAGGAKAGNAAEGSLKGPARPAYASTPTRGPKGAGSTRGTGSSARRAKDNGVQLSFPEFSGAATSTAVATEAVPAAEVPEAETGAPAGLVDAAGEPQHYAPPSSQPVPPAVPRLPGAAPAKSQASPWLKVTGQYRGKVEDWNTGFAVSDSYYLNRFRLQAEVLPSSWFRAVVQVQDARTADYSLKVVPTNMYNQFDVRLAFADIKDKKRGMTYRGGRQEFNLGEGRLVSAGDWSNVGRSFDGASAQWANKKGLLTVFATSVVVIDSKGIDELKHGEQFYGGLYTWTAKKSKRLFEPYVFVKAQDRAIDEKGNVGDALVTTVGMRAVGPITPHFDYNVETAMQGGHYAQDTHSAWAVHLGGGTTFAGSWKPRLGVDYDSASGDGTAKDGKRQTFDVLFGTNHAKFGLVDNIAWRNMDHVGVVFTATPVKEIKVTSGYHRIWIRDTRDGYYAGAGSKAKTKATNEQLFGDEIDLQVAVDLTKHISVLFGTGYMFAGPYQTLGVGRNNAFHQFFLWKVVF